MKKLWSLIGRVLFWLGWPALWFYLRRTDRTRVIVTAEDKVLLVMGWLGAGQWMLPGGGMHRGEAPVDAAVREVHEETGIELRHEQLVLKEVLTAREYGFAYRCHVYEAVLPEAVPLRAQKVEVSAAGWHDRARLTDISPLTADLLKQ